MKKETQELIDWIKHQINLSGECLVVQPNEYWKEDREKAFQFLDSLPNIEEKLCLGGYIQDKNGIPCCHGDKVKMADTNFIGVLKWNSTYRYFNVVNEYGKWILSSSVFEKIEND